MKQSELKLLLDIAKAISTVNNREDLFHLIVTRINPVFNCSQQAVIITTDPGQKTYRLFLSELAGDTAQVEQFKSRRFEMDPVIRMILDAPDGIIYQTEPFIRKYPELPGPRFVNELGVKEVMSCRLQTSGKIIGKFSLHAESINHFKAEHLPLFRAIADLVAIAISKIMADEEVEIKERQKSLLIEIGAQVGAVRDRNDLFAVIVNKIKPVLNPSGHAAVMIFDEAMTYHQAFLSIMPGMDEKLLQHLMSQRLPIDPVSRLLFEGQGPQVLFLPPFWEKYPDVAGAQVTKSLGIVEIMACPLTVAGRKIGSFHLLSPKQGYFRPEQFELFKAVSDIIAIAVSNILSNQEILDKEQQTERLYSISKNIATVRDKQDLFGLITRELKSFIPFDNALVSTVSANQESFSMYLNDFSPIEHQTSYAQAKDKSFPLEKNGIPYRVMHSDTPLCFDIKKEHFRNPEVDFLRITYQTGMRQSLATRLVYSGKTIGLFVLFSREPEHFTEQHISTIQSISSLISIALRNLLAIEEIESLSLQLRQDNSYLNEEINRNFNFEEIIGVSKPIQEVFKKVTQVAKSDSTVLISGETGTGKELIARAIHNLSPRKSRPLIKINCAALPATLIESELFGHEKGSFTGATERRIGKFELANGSSIFLDEIGELPLDLQAKLLRAIQEREIERVGGDRVIQVDVRIITATNRSLEKEVAANKFRQDLFYRLNVYPIELPPLRDRKEDIPLLAAHFIQKFSKKLGKKITGISPAAMEELVANDWPGNIRELEHTIERSMLLAPGKTIATLNLSKTIPKSSPADLPRQFVPAALKEAEKQLIVETLKYTKGRIRGSNGAAELLQILPTTLEARMKKLGIRKDFIAD